MGRSVRQIDDLRPQRAELGEPTAEPLKQNLKGRSAVVEPSEMSLAVGRFSADSTTSASSRPAEECSDRRSAVHGDENDADRLRPFALSR